MLTIPWLSACDDPSRTITTSQKYHLVDDLDLARFSFIRRRRQVSSRPIDSAAREPVYQR
jgi:hypothetical protein